jgi:hypothetical protein
MPIKLNGSSSGYTQIEAAAVAGNNTLTLPTASGTLMTTGGSNTFTANQIISVTDNTNAALRITQLGTGLALRIEDSANPDSTPFVVTATGDVGVGIAAPTAKIHIQGASTASAVSNITNYSGLQIDGSLATTGTTGITFQDGGGGGAGIGFSRGTSYDTNIAFYTNPASTAVGGAMTERMRIDSSGNVLVATSSAITGTNTLQVVNAATDSTQIRVRNSGSTAGNHWRYGTDSVNTIYIINHNSAGVYITNGATSWSALSDERTKDIIEPITDAVEKVSGLRAVIGKYKTDEDGTRRPFLIAQDVQSVFPEAVSIADQGSGHLGLSYTETIPLLVAAIKEQQATITALEARIATLEAI